MGISISAIVEGHGERDALPVLFRRLLMIANPNEEIATRIHSAVGVADHLNIIVVVAKAEYESWFLAAAPSLAGGRGLRIDLQSPEDHESIRGAKEWLNPNMVRPNQRYGETIDQAAFTEIMDLDQACRNASFRRLYDRILAFLRGD